MSENLHNDPFEDFLKKSLEQHKDEPSDGVWEKIAAQRALEITTETKEEEKSKMAISHRTWMAAASILLLFSAFCGQYFYFSSKINALQTQIEQIPQQQTTSISSDEVAISTPLHKEDASENSPIEQSLKTLPLEHIEKKWATEVRQQTATKASGLHFSTPKNKHSLDLEAENNVPSPTNNSENQLVQYIESKQNSTIDGQTNTIENANQLVERKTKETKEAKIVEPAQKIEDLGILDHLPKSSIALLKMSEREAPKAKVDFIQPNRQKHTKMDILVQTGIVQIKGKPNSRFNSPPHMSGHDPNMPNKNQITSIKTGVLANLHLSPTLRFRTGLAYEYLNTTQNLKPRLFFKDAKHGPSGPNKELEFDYSVNSGSSSIEVTVRADDVNAGSSWSPDDRIELEISTSHKQKSFFIPLELGLQKSRGRFTAGIYAGTQFQVIQSDKIDLLDINVNDNRLQFDKENGTKTMPFTKQSKVFMHTGAALNLGYSFNHRLSIHVEPSFTRSFLQDFDVNRTQLSAGLTYTL